MSEIELAASPAPPVPAIATDAPASPAATALHIHARFCIQLLAAVIDTVTGTRSSAG